MQSFNVLCVSYRLDCCQGSTVVVGCMCVQSTMVDETCIMQIQPKSDILLPEAIFTGC